MPAIVRVKRRIDEEPLNAFILNGKKRRVEKSPEHEEKDEISTVLKFAGTIKEPDNTATTQFAHRISKNEAKDLVQGKVARKTSNYTERARQEMRQSAQENRFKVVNCLRTTLPKESETDDSEAAQASTTEEDTKSLTIVDIEKNTNETENQQSTESQISQLPADSDTGYVYDLYLPDDDVQARNADLMDDNYLSAHGLHDIIFEDAFNDPHDDDNDSEDSNREDYFTNDYPDEDDELHSANDYEEEDADVRNMRLAVEGFVFDNNDEENSEENYNDASSDDDADYYAYEDPYVQSVDPENDNFVPDIDAVDVQDYEMAYARYKKRLLKRMNKDDSDDEGEGETSGDMIEVIDQEEIKLKLDRSSDVELYHSADEHE